MRLFCAKTPRREARMRRAGLLTLAGLLALPIWAQRPSAPAVPVVLITIDTLRADRVGAYGYLKAETPAIDELSRQGPTRTGHRQERDPSGEGHLSHQAGRRRTGRDRRGARGDA